MVSQNHVRLIQTGLCFRGLQVVYACQSNGPHSSIKGPRPGHVHIHAPFRIGRKGLQVKMHTAKNVCCCTLRCFNGLPRSADIGTAVNGDLSN